MDDDASRQFDLYPHRFFAFFHSTYLSQSPSSWQLCHLPTKSLFSVIYALCRQPYEAVISPTTPQLPSISSGHPYAQTIRSTTCSRTRISPLSRSFRCTNTGFVMVASTPEPTFSVRNRLQWRGELSQRPTFWREDTPPASPKSHTHKTSKSVSPACSGTLPTKTPLTNDRRLYPLALSWQMQQHLNPPFSSTCAPNTLYIFPYSSVYSLLNTPRHNNTGAPSSSTSGTCSSTIKMALLQKTPRMITYSTPME